MENPLIIIKGNKLSKQLSALFWLLIAATLIAFAAFLYVNKIFAPNHLTISLTTAGAGFVTLLITIFQANQNHITFTVYNKQTTIKRGRIVATIPNQAFTKVIRSGERITMTIEGMEKNFVVPSSIMTKKEFQTFKEVIGGNQDV